MTNGLTYVDANTLKTIDRDGKEIAVIDSGEKVLLHPATFYLRPTFHPAKSRFESQSSCRGNPRAWCLLMGARVAEPGVTILPHPATCAILLKSRVLLPTRQ
jgi:hypothetical protein